MRLLSVREVLELHRRILMQSGGELGVRDLGRLESALAQLSPTFNAAELYPSLTEKAAALAYFITQNHPFVDGNKRVGHAAMEVMLVLNGFEIDAQVDEQEQVMLAVAAAEMSRGQLTSWLEAHLKPVHIEDKDGAL